MKIKARKDSELHYYLTTHNGATLYTRSPHHAADLPADWIDSVISQLRSTNPAVLFWREDQPEPPHASAHSSNADAPAQPP